MEAKDYRIGNWVECFGVRQIIAIEEKKIKLDKEKTSKGVTSSINFEWCPISSTSLNPIPLTKQVLVDCGFEKHFYENSDLFFLRINTLTHGNISAYSNQKGFFIDLGTTTGYHFGTTNVKNLHQLQNLYFALTGQELEYKPKKGL